LVTSKSAPSGFENGPCDSRSRIGPRSWSATRRTAAEYESASEASTCGVRRRRTPGCSSWGARPRWPERWGRCPGQNRQRRRSPH
jgi:hypothetical protein